ncbi:aminotransferase class V-fold PLP-dependent enzyme [Candidatus Sumerlaeota bacterium]|nr:aminotransferase class V-fold PLP-dependent enzyme [Candidatus Sumerlaeota bacterium]
MDLAPTSDLFSQPDADVYFNSAGSTLQPEPVFRDVSEFTERVFRDPAKAATEGARRVQDLRENLARIMGATGEEIALTHHTAEGANVIANGIAWQAGDTILTLDHEYPSTVYPWMNVQRRFGVNLEFLQEQDGRADEERIVETIHGERPRLLAMSAVEWCTGYRYDLEPIGRACWEEGTFFFVDSAQALGITEIDVQRAHISAMAGSAWKWLFGPHGQGYLYLNSDALATIDPAFVGSESVVNWPEYLSYDLTFRPDARRFEYSTANLSALVWFDAGVKFIEEIGREDALAHTIYLQDCAEMGLRELGCEIRGGGPESTRSGIMGFRHPQLDSRTLSYDLRKKARIVALERDDFVRLAFHVHNTREGIDRLTETLKGLLA